LPFVFTPPDLTAVIPDSFTPFVVVSEYGKTNATRTGTEVLIIILLRFGREGRGCERNRETRKYVN
jgi:hypothetical protein